MSVFVCVASIQNQPKVFSAGLDIMEMYGKSPEHCGEFWKAVQEMWLKLYSSNMVTIAAINVCIKHTPQPSYFHSVPGKGPNHRKTEEFFYICSCSSSILIENNKKKLVFCIFTNSHCG